MMMMRRLLILLAVVTAWSVSLAGCGLFGDDGADQESSDQGSGEPVEGDDVTAAPVAELTGDGQVSGAVFVDGPCSFGPLIGVDDVRCGTVAVPMSWSDGAGRVELAVAVFPATGDDPAPDPVVYLEGGPGGKALAALPFSYPTLVAPLQAGRDVIVFDQRGVGETTPALTCDELTTLSRELEDDPGVGPDEAEARANDALGVCAQRLTDEGVDLAQYNSVANAHDTEAIRVALSYPRWNLFGVSYGTRLGLEMMRQHGEPVRSAVLDSVFPPQVDSTAEAPQTQIDSLNRVVASCAAEPGCQAQGDLMERLAAMAARLEAEPVQVEIVDFLSGGGTDTVYVDGYGLVGLVSQALYSPTWFVDLPVLLTELEAGDTSGLADFGSQLRSTESLFSDGMFFAVECNEEIAFADPAAVDAATPADPFGLLDQYDYASNVGPGAFATCEAFGSHPADAQADEAVVSDVPTLLMAGAFDPVTPVAWAEAAAETLSAGQVVVGPRASHGVSSDECGMSLVAAFLDAPDQPVDGACLEEARLQFIDRPVEPIVMEPFSRQNPGPPATVTGVRPAGWSTGPGGEDYRRQSVLDPTFVLQMGTAPGSAPLVEQALTANYGLTMTDLQPPDGLEGWTVRSGETDDVAVRILQQSQGSLDALIIIGAPPDEIDQMTTDVVIPAANVFTVTVP
ncbi:MAG: alpha/beta fold hydrolase [Acidimicrobiales bacterium]